MKVTTEVDAGAIMETLGKGIQTGAIAHWGRGLYHPDPSNGPGHISIEERLPGREHTVKHHLGARALQRGLVSRRCAGLPALERGEAPATVIDTLVQTCLFGEVLYSAGGRGGHAVNRDTGEFHEIAEGEPVPLGLVQFAKGMQVTINGCWFRIEDVDASTRQILLQAIPKSHAYQNRKRRRTQMAELARRLRRGGAPKPVTT